MQFNRLMTSTVHQLHTFMLHVSHIGESVFKTPLGLIYVDS